MGPGRTAQAGIYPLSHMGRRSLNAPRRVTSYIERPKNHLTNLSFVFAK